MDHLSAYIQGSEAPSFSETPIPLTEGDLFSHSLPKEHVPSSSETPVPLTGRDLFSHSLPMEASGLASTTYGRVGGWRRLGSLKDLLGIARGSPTKLFQGMLSSQEPQRVPNPPSHKMWFQGLSL